MVDLIVLLLLGGTGVLGWRRGLVVSACFGVLFVLAGIVAAAVAVAIGTPPPALAFFVGGMLAMIPPALRHEEIAASIQGSLPESIGVFDRAGGALFAGSGVLAVGWFVAAIVSVVPGESAPLRSVRASNLLGSAVEALPPQGTLGSIVLRSGLVPGLNGPLVLAELPDDAIAASPGVVAARPSVVQVRGIACNELSTGTAWMAAPGLLLTNAHVVAGQHQTYVAVGPRERGVPAKVTAFDPVNDVAALVVDTARLKPIPLATGFEHGMSVAAIGFPKGGEQRVSPGRLDRVASYDVEPLGGGAPMQADVLGFRASIQPGNSGSPLVLADGRAVGMVVATALGQRIDAGYGVPLAHLQAAIATGSRRAAVSTGGCLDEHDIAPGRGPQTPEPPQVQGREVPDEIAAEPLVDDGPQGDEPAGSGVSTATGTS